MAQKSPRAEKPAAPAAADPVPSAPAQPEEFLIAGFGSSAGGIEVLEEVLRGLPADAPLALVVVQHRARSTDEDLFPNLLQKHTSLQVVRAEDGTPLEPGRVYVAPADKLLGVSEGKFIVLGKQKPRDMSIDYFFRSLAAAAGSRAAAVLLSGANTDGTLGAKDIREQGGLVLAQDPETAAFPAMPRGVIDAGLADEVLPPDGLAEALAAYARGPRPRLGGPHPEEFPESDRDKLLSLLRRVTGHGFSSYKTSTVGRRIARRMSIHRIERPKDYVELVRSNSEEAQALFRELLIGVTRFFRDAEVFEGLGVLLAGEYLPALQGEQLRAWVAGCSTGEEAYSVAILLREAMEKAGVRLELTVYATDIDDQAVEVARRALYPENIAIDVSEQRLARFFTKEETGYRLRKEVRETVVFAVQNVLQDPPFSRLDLVSCRNLLMYLRPEAQETVLSQFAFGLKPGGLLFLGTAEGLRPTEKAFEEKNRELRIFRRTAEKTTRESAETRPAPPRYGRLPPGAAPDPKRPEGHESRGLRGAAERFLLEACVPPSVLVDRYGTIRYVHGRTGLFLEPATGEPTNNLMAMARPGLEHDLAIALGAAVAQKKLVVRRAVPVRTNGRVQRVDVYVRPVDAPPLDEHCFMVSFVEVGPPLEPGAEPPKAPGTQPGSEDRRDEQLRLLQQENERLREDLRVLVQEYETANEELQSANEELQSANEELQSANEELQSANEELETGKEELQSMNEEQASLNAELASKLDELSHVQDDMDNLLAGTNVATLFLDTALAIKRYTPAIRSIMELIPSDVGRPVGQLAVHLQYDGLTADAAEVLRTLQALSREVEGEGGAWYQLRIMPYRTRQNVIDGVVVTFHDVTGLKRSEGGARTAQALAEGVVETITEPLLILDADLRVESANPAFYRAFRATREETEGAHLYELGGGHWDIPRLRELLEEVIPKRGEVSGFPLEHDFPNLGRRRMRVGARRIEVEGVAPKILLAIGEITEVEG